MTFDEETTPRLKIAKSTAPPVKTVDNTDLMRLFIGVCFGSFLMFLFLLLSCAKTETTKDKAAVAIVGVANVVKLVDKSCAVSAVAARDVKLAETCAEAYGLARESLVSAAIGLDVWETDPARTACNILDAVKQIRMMGAGSKDVQTALTAAEVLASQYCRR